MVKVLSFLEQKVKMGKGTADQRYLTEFERTLLKFCKKIIDIASGFIQNNDLKKEFSEKWGKIAYHRSAGAGKNAGKLQRDNLHTRGQGAKNPLSNRNFRWTPLIIAKKLPSWAKSIEEIQYDSTNKEVIFKIGGNFKTLKPGKGVYNLPLNEPPYCVTEKHFHEFWSKLDASLKKEIAEFSESDWSKNATIIPASEYAYWTLAVESFIVCLFSVISAFYLKSTKLSVDLYREILDGWKKFISEHRSYVPKSNGKEQFLLLDIYDDIDSFVEELKRCPFCKVLLTEFPAGLEKEIRPENWSVSSFPWKSSKKKEGEKESIQLLHVKPLVEMEIRHTPDNVRYGHRWCNVAMADASLEYALRFFERVLKNHNKC